MSSYRIKKHFDDCKKATRKCYWFSVNFMWESYELKSMFALYVASNEMGCCIYTNLFMHLCMHILI